MKKLLIMVLALAMALSTMAVPAMADEVNTEEAVPAGNMAGGWQINEDIHPAAIPENALKAFDEAMEGFTGQTFEPLELIMTQVVAGTNYLFLCKGTLVTAEPVVALKLVEVYKPINDKAKVASICDFDIAELRSVGQDTIDALDIFTTFSEADVTAIMDTVMASTNDTLIDDLKSKVDEVLKADDKVNERLTLEGIIDKAAEAAKQENAPLINIVVNDAVDKNTKDENKKNCEVFKMVAAAVFKGAEEFKHELIQIAEAKNETGNKDAKAGAWIINPDITKTPSIKTEDVDTFKKAVEELKKNVKDVKFDVIMLLGTQVVAGVNKAILCQVTTEGKNPVKYLAVMYIYNDLEDKAEVLDIVAISEVEEIVVPKEPETTTKKKEPETTTKQPETTTKQPETTTQAPTEPETTTEEPTEPETTTEEPTEPETTTEEPTEPEPTTEEPTTEDPTTEQPTTEEPTTPVENPMKEDKAEITFWGDNVFEATSYNYGALKLNLAGNIQIAAGYFPMEGDQVEITFNSGTNELCVISLVSRDRERKFEGKITKWGDEIEIEKKEHTLKFKAAEDIKIPDGFEPKEGDIVMYQYKVDQNGKQLTLIEPKKN